MELQDGVNSYTGTRDTYTYDVNPTTVHGAEPTIVQDKNVGDERRSLLQFDLSAIPPGATIVSAELQFYVDTEGQGFNMHRMIVPWDESATTFASIGSRHFAADNVDAESAVNSNWPGVDAYVGSITVSVPPATIKSWIDGTMVNNGWLMIATHADDGQQLRSSEHATVTDRPKLTVMYSSAPNTAPDAPTLNAPTDASTGISTSPTLDVGVSDADSDPLTVTYYGRPFAAGVFTQFGQNTGVASGTNTTTSWVNLGAGQTFEWYVTVSDGINTTTGPTWTFHTVQSARSGICRVGRYRILLDNRRH